MSRTCFGVWDMTANPSTDVSSVVVKYIILDNLSQTTRIVSFSATNGNFVMKSTVRYVYGFSGTSFSFSFSTSVSILFTNYSHSHIFPYLLLLLVTSSSLLPTLLFSTFLHVLSLVYHNITELFLSLTPHSSVYKLFLFSIPTLFLSAICFLLIL